MDYMLLDDGTVWVIMDDDPGQMKVFAYPVEDRSIPETDRKLTMWTYEEITHRGQELGNLKSFPFKPHMDRDAIFLQRQRMLSSKHLCKG